MIRFLALICLVSLCCTSVFGQSSNYRAQARYYSAKKAFESGKYEDSARMCFESREFLGGKSNSQLQHMLVLSLYHAGRFKEAQKETSLFFSLHEGKEPQMGFDESVDQLTNNQVREITIILDEIDDKVRRDVEGEKKRTTDAKRLAEQRKAWEADLLQWRNSRRVAVATKINAILSGGYTAYYKTANGQRVTETGKTQFWYDERVGYRIQNTVSEVGHTYGLFNQGVMNGTWQSCAGLQFTLRPRDRDPKDHLSYEWFGIHGVLIKYDIQQDDITNGRRSVLMKQADERSALTLKWIRLDGEDNFDKLRKAFDALARLDAMPFEELDVTRTAMQERERSR